MTSTLGTIVYAFFTEYLAVELHQASGMRPDRDIESVDWGWRTTSSCRLRCIKPLMMSVQQVTPLER